MNSVFIHLIQSLSNNWWKNKTNKIDHFILKVKKQKLKSRRAEEPGDGTRPMRGQNRRGQWRTANQAELQQRDRQGHKETSYSPGIFFQQSFNRCTVTIELCGQYFNPNKTSATITEKTNRFSRVAHKLGHRKTRSKCIYHYIIISMLNTIYLYVCMYRPFTQESISM